MMTQGTDFTAGSCRIWISSKRYPWSESRTENSNVRQWLVIAGRYAAIYPVERRGVILQALFDQRQDPAVRIRIVRQITDGLPGPYPAE